MFRDAGASHLCPGEDLRRDNLIRAERLSRIDKRREDLASLSTLACSHTEQSVAEPFNHLEKRGGQYSLLIEEGRGLWIPSGIFAAEEGTGAKGPKGEEGKSVRKQNVRVFQALMEGLDDDE